MAALPSAPFSNELSKAEFIEIFCFGAQESILLAEIISFIRAPSPTNAHFGDRRTSFLLVCRPPRTLTSLLISPGLLLAGCTSSNSLTRLIYVASWTYQPIAQANSPSGVLNSTALTGVNLHVRVGYFGICAQSTGKFFCSSSISTLQLVQELREDPLSILSIADRYRNDVIYPGLL
jgi:hypothetical protein